MWTKKIIKSTLLKENVEPHLVLQIETVKDCLSVYTKYRSECKSEIPVHILYSINKVQTKDEKTLWHSFTAQYNSQMPRKKKWFQ